MHSLRLRHAVRNGLAGAAIVMLLGAPAALASTPTPPATVAARLGASHIPAEIVILVDISGSMTSDGLYPQVQQVLPSFIANLRKQDPRDVVAVVTFGTKSDTQTVYLGLPTASSIPLPATARSSSTDFGYAFQKALNILSQATARIKVGGVLLMSDGELDAPGDQQYATYSAPGWNKLRAMANGLGISVTGYGLPLTSNQTYTQSVNMALSHVFAQRQTLTADLGNIGAQLNLAAQQIMDSRVAAAAQLDSGRGVAVAWPGLPGQAGTPALDLGAGSADIKVRLTPMTSRIPLSVDGLTVTASGFPVPVTASLPSRTAHLVPGRPVTLPVHLTWRKTSGGMSPIGGSRSATGRLALHGRVTSPFSAAISGTFGDRAFQVGGLTGAVSTTVPSAVPAKSPLALWVIVILLILAVIAVLVYWRARLQGRLVLKPPDQRPGYLDLPKRRSVTRPTDEIIQIPGHVTVRNSLRGKKMLITLRLQDHVGSGTLQPGGRRMIAGVDVSHQSGQGYSDQTYGEWGYDDRSNGDRGYSDQSRSHQAYDDQTRDDQTYNDQGYDHRGYGGQGHGDRDYGGQSFRPEL
jgi:hypothetical protein